MYMAVTLDKYELPIAIGETAKELAQLVGTTEAVIYSSISHKRRRYVKVDIKEDEGE